MTAQLSMLDIFAAAEQEQKTAHMPETMEEAIPFFRGLIEKFHAALMVSDFEEAKRVSKEADDLAYKLNGNNPGIKAGPEAPCSVLEKATMAAAGTVPRWGQEGDFIVAIGTMQVRIEMDGIFGIGAMPVPGFSVHCVEPDRPFLSETGYRSFLGHQPQSMPNGTTPDAFVTEIIKVYMAREMKKGPVAVKPEYRERFAPLP